MERLIAQAFSIMSDEDKSKLGNFDIVLRVGDHGDGHYTICSDKYTDTTLPCYIFDHWKEAKIDDYSEMCDRIKERAALPYKYEKLFWAGQLSHPTRRKFVEKFSSHPKMNIVYHRDHWGHSEFVPSGYLSLPEHCDYKYMLDLQGNGYSGRTKFLLHMNRTLFYQSRTLHEYWFWNMKPFVHYIPVAEDLSDMEEKFDWAEAHPEECLKIASEGQKFALDNLKRTDAVERLKTIFINLGGKKKLYPTITLCVLACAKNEKYRKRLEDFVDSYGFKKSNPDVSAKIVFLVEDEPKPEFLDDSFGWFNCPGLPLSMRFVKYISEVKCDTDWTMQVDDDSSTDLDKTAELLEQYYDPKDPVVLMGGRNTDLEGALQSTLRIMKVPNFLFESNNISSFDTTPYFIHAWEPSIISKSAMEKIKSWDRLEEFMDICINRKPVFSDQAPYVAARLAKVPIAECLFLSPFCKSHDYSAINPKGRFSHIHYVTDKWNEYEQFKKNMLEAKNGFSITANPNAGDIWDFYAEKQGIQRHISIIRLDSDGKIGLYENFNEKYWRMEEKSIVLLNANNTPTCILKEEGEGKYIGEFIPDPEIKHCLSKIR